MFICPTCGKQFDKEDILTKHYLKCWKEEHPYHQSKSAPCSDSIHTRKANDDIMNFFNSFKKE